MGDSGAPFVVGSAAVACGLAGAWSSYVRLARSLEDERRAWASTESELRGRVRELEGKLAARDRTIERLRRGEEPAAPGAPATRHVWRRSLGKADSAGRFLAQVQDEDQQPPQQTTINFDHEDNPFTAQFSKLMPTVRAKVLSLVNAESCALFVTVGAEHREYTPAGFVPTQRTRRGIVAHVLRSGETVNADDPSGCAHFDAEVDPAGAHGLLAMPLRNDVGDTLGVVEVTDKPSSFSHEDELVLDAFAGYVGRAMHATIHSQLERDRARMSEARLEATHSVMTAGLHTEEALARAVDMFQRLVDCDRCTVYTVDAEEGVLWSKVSQGVGQIRLRIGEGLAGAAAQRGAIVNVRDAYADPRFKPEFDEKHGYRTRSVLSVPIKDAAGAVVGVTQMINKRSSSGVFEDADIALAESLSMHVGVAMRNAQLHEAEVKSRGLAQTLLEVSTVLSRELQTKTLIASVMRITRDVLQADRCTVFLIDEERQELWSTVASGLGADEEIRIPIARGVAGRVARSGELCNIPDAYEDPSFDRSVDESTGFRTRSILCMPIKDYTGKLIGVTQMINKLNKPFFDKNDEEILNAITVHMSISLNNAQLYAAAQRAQRRSEALLKILKASQDAAGDADVAVVIEKLVAAAAEVLGAEAASLFMVDAAAGQLYCKVGNSMRGLTLALGEGVAGAAAQSGRAFNSAATPPEELRELNGAFDRKMGTDSRAVLAVPVVQLGEVIAVFQAVNKEDGGLFSPEDQSLLAALADEVASALDRKSVALAFESALGADGAEDQASTARRSILTTHLATYTHAAGDEGRGGAAVDVRAWLQQHPSESSLATDVDLRSWEFDCFQHSEEAITDLAVSIFTSFGLLEYFRIPEVTMRRYLVAIRRQYLDNAYHNFYHGFSVLHVCYLIVSSSTAESRLQFLDILSLCIGAVCHDVGHNGRNNDFHIKTRSEIALTYNDVSVLENMHASICFASMARDNCDVLASLTDDDRRVARKMIVSAILATDMAGHVGLCTELKTRLKPDVFDNDDPKDRQLLVNGIIHAADVSNPALPWALAKAWADRVLEEFNAQAADEERHGLPVTAFMTAELNQPSHASLNIGFIQFCVQPLMGTISAFCPGIEVCLENIQRNTEKWEEMKS